MSLIRQKSTYNKIHELLLPLFQKVLNKGVIKWCGLES